MVNLISIVLSTGDCMEIVWRVIGVVGAIMTGGAILIICVSDNLSF